MPDERSPHNIRLSDEEAKALLVAIKNMEGDDNEALLKLLDKAEEKIRAARRGK